MVCRCVKERERKRDETGRKGGGEGNTKSGSKRRGSRRGAGWFSVLIAFGVPGHIPALEIRKGKGKDGGQETILKSEA